MKTKPMNRISPSGELMLYGAIGEWADELTADDVLRKLETMDAAEIVVRIHSSGGMVMDGLAIYNRLKASDKRVTVHIDGLAASIASVIAMAGDEVLMPENAWLMIHSPWNQTIGTANEHRKVADTLDGFEQTLIQIYKTKTGLPEKQIREMLQNETWLNAQDALELGFIDEIVTPVRVAASLDISGLKSVPKEVIDMTTTTVETQAAATDAKAELKRIAEIKNLAIKYSIAADTAANWIDTGTSLSDVRAAVLDMLAKQDAKANVGNGAVCYDNDGGTQGRVTAMAEALAARQGVVAAGEQARAYMHLSVADMARNLLEARGTRTSGMAPSGVVAMALHSTSDFPILLQSTGDRVLRKAYEQASAPFRAISRFRTARDFRPLTSVQLSEAPSLLEVKEGGEYSHGSMAEALESYSLKTFGRIFGISRQALINDDLGAFLDVAARYGRAAAETENAEISKLVTGNVKLADNKTLFHADHGNLGTAGALSETTLSEARKMMRKQKGLDGKTPVDARAKFLVVPAALETAAEKLLSTIYATTTAETNPFSGMLELLIDPRLDAISESAWYLFSDPSVLPCLEYAHLESAPGLYTEIENGFEIDGVRIKARLDFGCGALDFRGAFKNAGA